LRSQTQREYIKLSPALKGPKTHQPWVLLRAGPISVDLVPSMT
jgi:hypothetical protein